MLPISSSRLLVAGLVYFALGVGVAPHVLAQKPPDSAVYSVAPAPAPEPGAAPIEAPAGLEVTVQELQALQAGVQGDALSASRPMSPSTALGPVGPGTASGSMNPDLSVILDAAAATYSHDALATGEHDPGESGFTLQQLELHIGANVDPFFRLDGNIVYTAHGVELEEAFATTLALPLNLQLRSGQFLSRFGRLNSTHPHQWHFADQPLILGKFFGGDGNRGVGVEASYLADLPWFTEVILSAQGVSGACCARTYERTPLTDVDAEQSQPSPGVMWTGALKQFFPLSANISLLWGLSAQTGPQQIPESHAVILGTDAYLRWRPLVSDRRESVSLQIEALWRRRAAPLTVARRTLDDWGGYAQLVWGINALWEAGLRAERVTGVSNDPLDPQWTQARTRFAAQATFYPTHFSRLRGQILLGRPGWLAHNIVGVLVTLEVLVGAHGAHTY